MFDSYLLAGVYLEMIGGREPGLIVAEADDAPASTSPDESARRAPRAQPLAPRISEAEKKAHDAFVDAMGDKAVWKQFAS